MKRLGLLAWLFVVTLAHAQVATRARLVVDVVDLRSDAGSVGCLLYASAEGFPTDPARAAANVRAAPNGRRAQCVFDGLAPGSWADIVIVEDRHEGEIGNLVGIERSAIRAVVRAGVPLITDPDFAGWFDATSTDAVPVTLDGRHKLLAKSLADPALIALEPGLELANGCRLREESIMAGVHGP
jgi:hypothetical protein